METTTSYYTETSSYGNYTTEYPPYTTSAGDCEECKVPAGNWFYYFNDLSIYYFRAS